MPRTGWCDGPLESLVTLQRGFDITKKEQEPGPYEVISSSGPNSTHSDFKVAGPGVVIGRKGTLGTVFYSERAYWPHDTTLWVKDFHGNHPKFCYYFLKTMGFERFDCGASNPTLNRNHIHQLPIQYPCFGEQRRIVSILSAYDDLIENNTRRIKILEDMAQMLYREWFVSFRFPGHEQVRMVESELGPIPERWRVGRLEDAIVLQRGFDLPTAQRIPGSVPIIAATGLNGTHNVAKVKGPGVVTGRSGSLGTVMLVWEDFWPLNTTLWVKEFRQSNPIHAYFTLQALDLKGFNSGAAVPTLNRNDINGLPTVLPDTETLNTLNEYAVPFFTLKRNLETKNANLRTTRDFLLPKLISGELPVEAAAELVEQAV